MAELQPDPEAARFGNLPKNDIPPDRVERPSVSNIYTQTFGAGCAQVAYEAYSAALRSDPAHEFAAVMAGHKAGRRCQDETFRRFTDAFPERPSGPKLELEI